MIFFRSLCYWVIFGEPKLDDCFATTATAISPFPVSSSFAEIKPFARLQIHWLERFGGIGKT
jgi:hypothetical protein